ncbi:hypothetical protein [Isoptericola sp. NPDC056605]|uniref:hypothetical protein n=1 Tax=Isoptericola sp. NPDC056605 TaxID=3345876 RepID=UPI0036A92929
MKTLDELIRTYGGGPGVTEEVWLPSSQVRQVIADRERTAAAKALRDAASEQAVMQYQGSDYPVRAVPLAVLFDVATRIERGEG